MFYVFYVFFLDSFDRFLHESTDVEKAADQNGDEVDEAPTWNPPGPPPEAEGTVAGRPKASRLLVFLGVSWITNNYGEGLQKMSMILFIFPTLLCKLICVETASNS